MYEAHLPAIVRYLRRRLGDAAAEDAAADVFVRAMGHQSQDLTLPWLYGIAANVIAERRREERRRLRAMQRAAASAPIAGAEHERLPVSPALVRTMSKLRAADRECLLLVAWGELSYAEVAAALGIPVGTVRSRVARARRQLQPTTERPSRGRGQESER